MSYGLIKKVLESEGHVHVTTAAGHDIGLRSGDGGGNVTFHDDHEAFEVEDEQRNGEMVDVYIPAETVSDWYVE